MIEDKDLQQALAPSQPIDAPEVVSAVPTLPVETVEPVPVMIPADPPAGGAEALPIAEVEVPSREAVQSAAPVGGYEASAASMAAPSMAGMAKFNVLLVEDDQFLNSLLRAKLEKGGVGVTLAIDGEAAIKALEESARPDLILLDLILPGKSGFEVMAYIQGNPQVSSVPVIILSNLSQDSDVSKVKEMGAVEYYVKAKTSIDDLVARVEEFLNKAKI